MLHLVLIVAHALFGAAALAAGVLALERPPRWLRAYVVSLALMLATLVGAVASEWSVLDTGTRILFVGLCALGVFVVARGIEAWRIAPRAGRPPIRYGHAVGFTVVALTDAFFVILVLDLGAPAWAVVATGVVVAAIGHVGLRARLAALERRWAVLPADAPVSTR